MIEPKSIEYGWPSIEVDRAKLGALVALQRNGGWHYGLGDKIDITATDPSHVLTHRVDCSGEVRWLMYQCAGIKIPDGSVNQHDWVKSRGFKKSDVKSGKLKDGRVRIAFLEPAMTTSHIGHVVLIWNGMTYESHGGKGPDSRPWTGLGWQAKCKVYVLDPREL